jgi:hypothetical protein
MALSDLHSVPETVLAAGAVTRRIDAAFARGFARVTEQTLDDLSAVARVMTGTPLGPALAQAVATISDGVQVAHLLAVAHARVALEGARYDGLLAQAAQALDAPLYPNPGPQAEGGQPLPQTPQLESVQHWLLEVALCGFMQLERATIAPFLAVLEGLQEHPDHRRLSALLTGFVSELLDHAPTASLDHVPARRWTDLWTRALLLTERAPQSAASALVSGVFTPLGVHVNHHDNLAAAQVWGVLKPDGGDAQVARVHVSAWKVDVVTGAEVWSLLAGRSGGLLQGLYGNKAFTIKQSRLSSTGDLYWHADDVTGQSAHPGLIPSAQRLLPKAAQPRALPFDRYPAQLAALISLQGGKVQSKDDAMTVTVDGATLPLAMSHVGPLGVDAKLVQKTGAMVGLLRFDAERWAVQPLTVEGKEGVAQHLDKGLTLKGGVTNVLKERASKLLRKKS